MLLMHSPAASVRPSTDAVNEQIFCKTLEHRLNTHIIDETHKHITERRSQKDEPPWEPEIQFSMAWETLPNSTSQCAKLRGTPHQIVPIQQHLIYQAKTEEFLHYLTYENVCHSV